MMKEFEKYENIPQVLKANGFATLEEARDLCLANGIDVEKTVKDIQPICFDSAVWAYTLGTAIALKSKHRCNDQSHAE